MTHWTPQRQHLLKVYFGLYLFSKQRLAKAARDQAFFGTPFAKVKP
jgi:hypothetical protein